MTPPGQYPARAPLGAPRARPHGASSVGVQASAVAARIALRRWLARQVRGLFIYLLPAWCLLALGAGNAAAASLAPAGLGATEAPAPMCDPSAASVAAPLDIPEVDGGRLEELPCEARMLMSGWRLDAPEFGEKAALQDPEPHPPQQLQHHRSHYEGACGFSVVFPSRWGPVVACAPLSRGLAAQPGHQLAVYRPPVARA